MARDQRIGRVVDAEPDDLRATIELFQGEIGEGDTLLVDSEHGEVEVVIDKVHGGSPGGITTFAVNVPKPVSPGDDVYHIGRQGYPGPGEQGP